MYHAHLISTERYRVPALLSALNRLRDTRHASHWPVGCFDIEPVEGAGPEEHRYARLVYVSREPLPAQVVAGMRWYARALGARRRSAGRHVGRQHMRPHFPTGVPV